MHHFVPTKEDSVVIHTATLILTGAFDLSAFTQRAADVAAALVGQLWRTSKSKSSSLCDKLGVLRKKYVGDVFGKFSFKFP